MRPRAIGGAFGTETAPIDIRELAEAIGINYCRLDGSDPRSTLAAAAASPGVTLVEAPAHEARSMRTIAAETRIKRLLRRG